MVYYFVLRKQHLQFLDITIYVLSRLCELALYNTKMRTFNMKSEVARVLSTDFREV